MPGRTVSHGNGLALNEWENGFALNGRRIIGSGAGGLATLLDGLATPWLFAAVYPFFTDYVWRWYSPASASRIGALYTALWIAEGFLLVPAVRRIAGASPRALTAAALLIPLLRFNVIWGSARFGALEIFILLERAVSWTVFLAEPSRSGRIRSRLARYLPWFFGVALGSGMVAMAARWLETDPAMYIAAGGAAGLAAALLKTLSVQLVPEPAAGFTSAAEAPPPAANHWVPLALIFAVLVAAGLLPKDLAYLSPGIEQHLRFWEPLDRSMWIAALAVLVLLPAERFRLGYAAGALLILLSGIPGLAGVPGPGGAPALTLLGAGLGAMALCLVDGSAEAPRPGRLEMLRSVKWSVGTIACFRGFGVLVLDFTFSGWLMAGVALAAVLAFGLWWRKGSRPAETAGTAETG